MPRIYDRALLRLRNQGYLFERRVLLEQEALEVRCLDREVLFRSDNISEDLNRHRQYPHKDIFACGNPSYVP